MFQLLKLIIIITFDSFGMGIDHNDWSKKISWTNRWFLWLFGFCLSPSVLFWSFPDRPFWWHLDTIYWFPKNCTLSCPTALYPSTASHKGSHSPKFPWSVFLGQCKKHTSWPTVQFLLSWIDSISQNLWSNTPPGLCLSCFPPGFQTWGDPFSTGRGGICIPPDRTIFLFHPKMVGILWWTTLQIDLWIHVYFAPSAWPWFGLI